MNSIKCSKCGFTNWVDAERCKKCESKVFASVKVSQKTPQRPLKSPSLLKIISNDQLIVMFGIIFPLVVWGIHIAMNIFGFSFTSKRSQTSVSGDGSYAIPIAFTVLGGIITVWRTTHLNNIFKNGNEIVGEITEVTFIKDRGRIDYSYLWNGKKFSGTNSIMKNSGNEKLQSGNSINVVVNSQKPSQSLISDFYS